MSAFVRRVLAIRQDCAYCGEPVSYGDYGPRYATIDHIVSRARGGHEGKSNKTLSCLHCNRSKGCATRWPTPRYTLADVLPGMPVEQDDEFPDYDC